MTRLFHRGDEERGNAGEHRCARSGCRSAVLHQRTGSSRHSPIGGGLELCGGSSRIYLLCKDAGSNATAVQDSTRRYQRHWCPVHLDFIVDDIDGAVQRALSAGALMEGPIQTDVWGRLAVLADPFGHGFCLVQFLGRGYDEIASPP